MRTKHSPLHRCSARREGGFTLVEILVVMAIIAALAGLILVATGTIQSQARTKRTEALLDRLTTYIAEYQRITGELPPDGMDTKVEVDGESIPSSAALYKALAEPIVDKYFVAGEYKIREIEPIADFEPADLKADEEIEGLFHIIDGFDRPIHYDNLTRRRDPPDLSEEEYTLEENDKHGLRKSKLGYELWALGMRADKAESGADVEEDE